MTWNYRLLKYPHGSVAVHEVYYDDDGEIYAYTEDPVSFGGNDKEDAIRGLELALKDVIKYEVLDKAEIDARFDSETG